MSATQTFGPASDRQGNGWIPARSSTVAAHMCDRCGFPCAAHDEDVSKEAFAEHQCARCSAVAHLFDDLDVEPLTQSLLHSQCALWEQDLHDAPAPYTPNGIRADHVVERFFAGRGEQEDQQPDTPSSLGCSMPEPDSPSKPESSPVHQDTSGDDDDEWQRALGRSDSDTDIAWLNAVFASDNADGPDGTMEIVACDAPTFTPSQGDDVTTVMERNMEAATDDAALTDAIYRALVDGTLDNAALDTIISAFDVVPVAGGLIGREPMVAPPPTAGPSLSFGLQNSLRRLQGEEVQQFSPQGQGQQQQQPQTTPGEWWFSVMARTVAADILLPRDMDAFAPASRTALERFDILARPLLAMAMGQQRMKVLAKCGSSMKPAVTPAAVVNALETYGRQQSPKADARHGRDPSLDLYVRAMALEAATQATLGMHRALEQEAPRVMCWSRKLSKSRLVLDALTNRYGGSGTVRWVDPVHVRIVVNSLVTAIAMFQVHGERAPSATLRAHALVMASASKKKKKTSLPPPPPPPRCRRRQQQQRQVKIEPKQTEQRIAKAGDRSSLRREALKALSENGFWSSLLMPLDEWIDAPPTSVGLSLAKRMQQQQQSRETAPSDGHPTSIPRCHEWHSGERACPKDDVGTTAAESRAPMVRAPIELPTLLRLDDDHGDRFVELGQERPPEKRARRDARPEKADHPAKRARTAKTAHVGPSVLASEIHTRQDDEHALLGTAALDQAQQRAITDTFTLAFGSQLEVRGIEPTPNLQALHAQGLKALSILVGLHGRAVGRIIDILNAYYDQT